MSGVDSYALLDFGRTERLEQWGPYRLRRPDPRAVGSPARPDRDWTAIDARFEGEAGRGGWQRLRDVPERWTIDHGGVSLVVKLAPFKHTGVFPEQAEHWRWMTRVAQRTGRLLEILNLFAYTGGATMALARAGHKVTHVDASKPAIVWAHENAAANDLASDAVRWIQDDAATFVRRELRRGRRYDAVLMDPPAFGHAPRGGVWRVDDQLPALIRDAAALLDDPVFFLVNHYAKDAGPRALARIVADACRWEGGRWEQGTLRLRAKSGTRLETGVYVRWTATSLACAGDAPGARS
jgi:23S rRNA (cytosine1962-C5)-methyltransferase